MDLLEVMDKTNWRLDLLKRKTFGGSPELKWSEIGLAMLPERLWEMRQRAVRCVPPCDLSVQWVRREGSLVLWGTRFGPIWARQTDGRTILELTEQIMDRRVYDQQPAGIKEDDVVVDAGAHLGAFTHYALNQYVKKVIAFEPDPGILECYRKTFAEEIEEGLVVPVEAAAWDRRERFRLRLWPDHYVHGKRWPRKSSVEVQAQTIDETLAELGIDHVDYIKLNTGGAERRALAGAAETIRRSRPRMTICTAHQPDDVQVLREMVAGFEPEYNTMRRRDYDYYYWGEGWTGPPWWLSEDEEDEPEPERSGDNN